MKDVYNSNLEVFVTFQDGFTLTIIVGTPQNLQYLMEKDEVNFYGPGLPWIIVQKLTKEIIYEAIKAYMFDKPDGYWLKLYHFAPNINMSVFDQIQAQEIKKDMQVAGRQDNGTWGDAARRLCAIFAFQENRREDV